MAIDMTALDAAWGSAISTLAANGGDGTAPPSPGIYDARVSTARAGESKKGEFYFSLTWKLADGTSWDEVKMLTKDGKPHDGRMQSGGILLRGLGLNVPLGALPEAIKTIVNKHYRVEVKQSGAVNTNTGDFYVNTDVLGPSTGPVGSDLDVPQAAPVQASPAALPQMGVPPTAMAPAQPAGAQFGDDIPWDQPAGVQPSQPQGGAAA